MLGSAASGPAISGLVNATARSSEELTVLQEGAPPKIILSSASLPPATVAVPGKPTAPRGDQNTYQAAQYANRVKHWRGEVTAGRNAEATQVRDSLAAWLRGLSLTSKIGQLADPLARRPAWPLRARPPPVPWPALRRNTAMFSAADVWSCSTPTTLPAGRLRVSSPGTQLP